MKFKQQMLASATLVMRMAFIQTVFFVCFGCSLYAKEVNAQNLLEKRITLNVKEESLLRVINLIKKQTNVKFSFIATAINADRIVTYSVKNKKLAEFLNELAQYNIGYRLVDDQVVLFQNKNVSGNNEESAILDIASIQQSVSQADIEIFGYVYDDTNLPLPGASISVKGTTQGTSTNEKGFFRLKVKDASAVLVVKSVGFTTREIRVGSQTSLKISLKSEANNLADVVINVGYGTQKKITSTGSTASIGTKELVQSPVANISNSLVGRLPGLFASQAGGEPGKDQSTLRIRGIGSFNGSSEPLVLVDGIQVDNYNNIDPNEIENLTLLKDASATAVYGIRGANGVILITTKRGKSGKPKISYTFNTANNTFTNLRNTMSSYDYATSWNKGIELDAFVQGFRAPAYSEVELEKFRTGSDPVLYPSVNWYDLVFKESSNQSQHNINVSGGQNKVKYFISAGMFDQEGLFNNFKNIEAIDYDVNSTYKRYNFRSNFNFDLTKRFKISLDLSSQIENRKQNNNPNSTNFIIASVGRAAPMAAPGVVDGKLVEIGGSNNPLIGFLTNSGSGGIKREYRNNLTGSLKLDYSLDFVTKGLGAHGMVSMQGYNGQDVVNAKNIPWYRARRVDESTIVYTPNGTIPAFNTTQTGSNRRKEFAQLSLDYNRAFGNHTVTGLVLYDQQKEFNQAFAYSVPNAYQSVVSRVTYNYKGKYLADINGAYNGTENFAKEQRFGFFPAASIGWIPSEESFFPKNKVISFLKVRASYGLVGSDRAGDINSPDGRFLYRPTAYTYLDNVYRFGAMPTSYTGVRGVKEGRAGNPDVTWERAKKANLALETYLYKDKFKLVAEVFDERRNSILADINTISAAVGFLQPKANIGRMKNQGYEGELIYTDKAGEFDYRISANYSFARNKVLFRDEIPQIYGYQARTGHRLGQMFGKIADGIYNTWEEVDDINRPFYENSPMVRPGDLKYRDINGDGIINSYDEVPIGYSNVPEKTFGLSLYGQFKGFDLSVLFQGADNVSYYYTGFQRSQGWLNSAELRGTPDYIIESWTPERYAAGLPINYPRLSSSASNNPNNQTSSFWQADASYIRLKNVEFGYSFKNNVLRKVGMSSLRLFVTANNLVTWHNMYKGIDPENVSPSDTNNQEAYPLVRTINAGINVNF